MLRLAAATHWQLPGADPLSLMTLHTKSCRLLAVAVVLLLLSCTCCGSAAAAATRRARQGPVATCSCLVVPVLLLSLLHVYALAGRHERSGER